MDNNRKKIGGHDLSAEVTLYVDGGSNPKTRVGGRGFISIHHATGKETQGSGCEIDTTTYRMEISATIEGISKLERSTVLEIVSDSELLLQACAKWRHTWKKNNWMLSANQPCKSADLWRVLAPLLDRHTIRYVWVRARSGDKYSEQCNSLVKKEIKELDAAIGSPFPIK